MTDAIKQAGDAPTLAEAAREMLEAILDGAEERELRDIRSEFHHKELLLEEGQFFNAGASERYAEETETARADEAIAIGGIKKKYAQAHAALVQHLAERETGDADYELTALCKVKLENKEYREAYVASLWKRINKFSRALAASTEGRIPEGWQPVATAPKDGTHVLVGTFPEAPGQISRTTAHWFDSRNYGAKSGGAGWALSVNYDGEHSDHGVQAPTHWQPLPASPPPPSGAGE